MKVPGYEEVWEGREASRNFHAFIALHRTSRGPALGGVRFWPYPNREAALQDVLRLARAMTYKAAAVELPFGGGKAVIQRPPEPFEREVQLRLFGRMIQTLQGRYITAKDVGTHSRDMAVIKEETKWVTGLPRERGGVGDPSPWTSLGVLAGLEAGWTHLKGTNDLGGVRVLIQGLGEVGRGLARLLRGKGAQILGCDVDHRKVERLHRKLGLEGIEPESPEATDAQIFAPCALGQILNARTIPLMRFQLIAGGANDQLEDETRDAEALRRRGILYAPDFIINAGGLIHVAYDWIGYDEGKVRAGVERIGSILREVFAAAGKKGGTTQRAAMEWAESRL